MSKKYQYTSYTNLDTKIKARFLKAFENVNRIDRALISIENVICLIKNSIKDLNRYRDIYSGLLCAEFLIMSTYV